VIASQNVWGSWDVRDDDPVIVARIEIEYLNIALALKSIPKEVLDEYRQKAEQLQMKKRFGLVSAFVLLFWFALLMWLIKILLKLS
jgi:hypothetical protein